MQISMEFFYPNLFFSFTGEKNYFGIKCIYVGSDSVIAWTKVERFEAIVFKAIPAGYSNSERGRVARKLATIWILLWCPDLLSSSLPFLFPQHKTPQNKQWRGRERINQLGGGGDSSKVQKTLVDCLSLHPTPMLPHWTDRFSKLI